MRRKSYVLTARAAADLREARVWSRAPWGKELTNRYFDDLHEGAQFIADNHASFRARHELAGGTALLVYPVREHYIVYEPLAPRPIRRELIDIRRKIESGEIAAPSRKTPRAPRKKR